MILLQRICLLATHSKQRLTETARNFPCEVVSRMGVILGCRTHLNSRLDPSRGENRTTLSISLDGLVYHPLDLAQYFCPRLSSPILFRLAVFVK
jgi:hypothetical protein